MRNLSEMLLAERGQKVLLVGICKLNDRSPTDLDSLAKFITILSHIPEEWNRENVPVLLWRNHRNTGSQERPEPFAYRALQVEQQIFVSSTYWMRIKNFGFCYGAVLGAMFLVSWKRGT